MMGRRAHRVVNRAGLLGIAVLVGASLAARGGATESAQPATPAPSATPARAASQPSGAAETKTAATATAPPAPTASAGRAAIRQPPPPTSPTASAPAGSPSPTASPPPTGAAATPSGPAGTPADPTTVERVGAVLARAYARLNAGDYVGYAVLFTPKALRTAFDTADAYAAAAVLAGRGDLPPHELVSVDAVLVRPDGRLDVEVTAMVGGRPARGAAALVHRDGVLLIDVPGGLLPFGPEEGLCVRRRDC